MLASLLPAQISSVPHPMSSVRTLHVTASQGSSSRPAWRGGVHAPALVLCSILHSLQSQLPLRFHAQSSQGGGGSHGVGSAPAQGPADGGKQSGAGWQPLSSPGQVPQPPPGPLTSLTYFPFPFRERVQQSQEHGKVSMIAFPHLIAIPPSLNASPRLPLWQHLLTFLQQEASPGCVAPSGFQGLGLGERWERDLHEPVQGCWAGPSPRTRTSCARSGSGILWLFLGIDQSSASFSFCFRSSLGWAV